MSQMGQEPPPRFAAGAAALPPIATKSVAVTNAASGQQLPHATAAKAALEPP